MRDPRRFWNRIARRYAASPVADEASYQKKLEQTQARFAPDWAILEVGCGTGNTAIAHAPHVAHVTAVDFSEALLSYGRRRAAKEGIENITFTCAALDDLAAETAYDAVLMLSVLHLIPDWRGAIAKAYALTRPGGIFVSSTACMADMGLIARNIIPLLAPTGLVPPIAVFSADDLRAAMVAQGFTLEEDWQPGPGKALFLIARRP